MKLANSFLLALALAIGLAPRLKSQTWDVAADYSAAANPSQAWGYGYRTTPAGTALSFLPVQQTIPEGIDYWHLSYFPQIGHVHGPNGAFWSTGDVLMHPGANDHLSIARWTAPISRVYRISCRFTAVDSRGPNVRVYVIRNGAIEFEQALIGQGTSRGFTNSYHLAAGEVVDFAVGNNDAPGDQDYTKLEAKVEAVLPARTSLPGIVARYTMEGEARDSVGASHPSAVTDVTYVPGIYGQGAKFGPSGGIVIPSTPALENQRFTWEAWVRLDGPGPRTEGTCIIQKAVNGAFGYSLYWHHDSSTFLFYAENNYALFAANKFEIGGLYHVVGSYDGSQFRLFVNGALEAEMAASTTINYSGQPWMIGDNAPDFRAQGYPRSWDGIIDEVSIYNRALSPQEIAANYAAFTSGAIAPIITAQPQSQTVTAGGNVTFSVSARGIAPLGYQWLRDGANIPGATSATVTLSNVTLSHSGGYSVVVSNAPATGGSTTSEIALLKVNPAGDPPIISEQPRDQFEVAEGTTVTFSVTATGTAPLSYQWQRNAIDLSGATSPALTLVNVRPSQDGAYTVVVSNAFGRETSSPAALHVAPTPIPPTITVQPESQTVAAGGSVTFRVTAIGSSPIDSLIYQWRREGVDLPGENNATLPLSNVTASQAGTYTVIVALQTFPTAATQSAPAVLTVAPALIAATITQQPQSRTVTAGQSATFSVTAAGNPAPTFQWRLNGVNIPGATGAEFSIPAAQANQAGLYTVEVSNPAGRVISSPAALSLLNIDVYPGLTIIGPAGTRYRIDYALEADAANWTELTTLTLPTSPYTFSDYSAPVRTRRFYRAVALP